YDAENRVIEVTPDAAFGVAPIRFTWSPTGQRTSMTDGTGTTRYQYDARDRLISQETPRGTLTYGWDSAGNLTSLRSSNAGGFVASYEYDGDNRLLTVDDAALGATHYTWDAAGNEDTVTLPNGVRSSHVWDAANRLTRVDVTAGGTDLASFAYSYDA